MRIALRDFLGRPRNFYSVQRMDATPDQSSKVPAKSHHIVIVDRSGSMYYDMESMKAMIEKVFTLDEFRDAGMLVTLISYSSSGDYTEHFVRSSISEIMQPGSPQIKQIRELRVTGLTCVSQAMRAAINHVRNDEVTAISLHSDGYFNDMSPGAERREIDDIVTQYQKLPNVFVNTIAHRGYCDFALLGKIANSCSGQCFRTPTIKEFYSALEETSKLVSGNLQPAINVSLNGADYVTFVSEGARKYLGGSSDFQVLGVPAGVSSTVYRWETISESEYNALPESSPDQETQALLSFAATKLAEGRLNEAKYALISARATGLLASHGRALTNPQVAVFADDLEKTLFGDIPLVQTPNFGMPGADEASVLKVLSVMSRYARDIKVDVEKLAESYQRRGVRRIPGTRLDDGTVQQPNAKSVFRDGGTWGQVDSFDLNRDTATINMQISRPIDIVRNDTGEIVREAGGRDLTGLKAYNNYTVVGDGSLNVSRLAIQINNEVLHRRLVDLGVLGRASKFEAGKVYNISLEGRPLVDYGSSFSTQAIDNFFDKVAPLMGVASIIRAATPSSASEELTESQVQELASLHITPAMYFSPPTTTEYADLNEALSQGSVDSYVKYKVTFGNSNILNGKALPSANAFLKRRFDVSVKGEEQKSPSFEQMWDGWEVKVKALSAKTKLTPVDDLLFPIFEDFLGTNENGRLGEVLASAGLSSSAVQNVYRAIRGKLGKDELVSVLADARRDLGNAIDNLFDEVSNIVFYIGSTGLLPEEFGDINALNSEQISQRYADLKIGKSESDGTFYDLNGTVLSIFPETAYFSTDRPAASA